MRVMIITPWQTGVNAPQLDIDHPLPNGASWMDVTGQQSYQIPTQPNRYVVECWQVTQEWLDAVTEDDTYLVLWSAADDAEPSGTLTSDQLAAIRGYFSEASTAQLDAYIGTVPDNRTVTEVAEQVIEWSSLFLRQDEMSPEDYAELVNRYPQWQVGVAYAAGELVAYNDNLYEVVQAHTSQSDWQPDQTPALYTHAVPQSVIPEWVQPTGQQDAYQIGDRVTYNGSVWESLVNGNTWEPGSPGAESLWLLVDDDGGEEPTEPDAWQPGVTYAVDDLVTYDGATYRCLQSHTSQVGWHPVAVPAMWQLV